MIAHCRFLVVCVAACNTPEIAAIDASTSSDVANDAPSFSFDGAAFDAPGPRVPDALPPPQLDCLDAGDAAAACPIPPSLCANDQWLEYFDDGECVDGGCRFTAKLYACETVCVDGGCVVSHLTAP